MSEPTRPDRTRVIGEGVARTAVWSGRAVLITLGLVVVGLVVK